MSAATGVTRVAWLALLLCAAVSARGQTPLIYTNAYQSGLFPSWIREAFENNANDIVTDFAAVAPGRAGLAIEARWTTPFSSFGLANRKPGFDNQFMYLNEFRTVEFDIYFETNSTGHEGLVFVLEDFSFSDQPRVVDLIPGFAGLTAAQRLTNWFHVTVDLPPVHPTIARFHRFLLFNNSQDARPRFRMMDVKLGRIEDTTPPVITLNSAVANPTFTELTLNFTTDEPALFRVDFGFTNFASTFAGPADDWTTNHSATLTGLRPGSNVVYRIVASDHRTDTNAAPNVTLLTNSFLMPPVPTVPPVISGLAASNILGYRATLVWTTDRACSARLTYRKSGGAPLTRTFANLATNRAELLDLLEPSTTYLATVIATDAFSLSTTQAVTFVTTGASTPTVTITFTPTNTRPISPWIYGLNLLQGDVPNAPTNVNIPFHRMGGNRWTAYNWENNASNAGTDYGPFSNDDYLGGGDVPAEAVRSRIAQDRTNGAATMVTVQLQGFAAADKSGFIATNEVGYLTNHFKPVVFRKGAAFTATPPTNDNAVFMDEFISVLRGKFTNDIFADALTPTFVSLDNEPDLWRFTHPEIQLASLDATNYIARTIALAKAVKDVAPAAQLFGPVNFGFPGIFYLQESPGFSVDFMFFDKYLQDLKAAGDADGRRLLDVYDFHWYSEVTVNGTTVTQFRGTNLTDAQVQGIAQSPRSLWDPTFREDSYITSDSLLAGPIRLLTRLQAKIDARYPGTKMAISEYENGGGNHIAGALAQADNLGIFGAFGIYAASFWPTGFGETYPFVYGAFDMYRNFDGQRGSFGDISIAAASSDVSKVAVYLSRDSARTNRFVMVAINRSTNAQDVAFNGLAVSGTARVFRLQGTSATPAFVGELPMNLTNFVIALPALSVSTIEILRQESFADWRSSVFTAAEQSNPAISGPDAAPDGARLPNLLRYAFNLPARGPVDPAIVPQIVPSAGQNFLGIQFNRKPVAPDLLYVIEHSSTLTNWTQLTTVAPGEPTRTSAQDTAPMTANPRRFYRVRVQFTP